MDKTSEYEGFRRRFKELSISKLNSLKDGEDYVCQDTYFCRQDLAHKCCWKSLNIEFSFHFHISEKRCYRKVWHTHRLTVKHLHFERRKYFFTLSNSQPQQWKEIQRFKESAFKR